MEQSRIAYYRTFTRDAEFLTWQVVSVREILLTAHPDTLSCLLEMINFEERKGLRKELEVII